MLILLTNSSPARYSEVEVFNKRKSTFYRLIIYKQFKGQPHKMVKHTQIFRRQNADELFECV